MLSKLSILSPNLYDILLLFDKIKSKLVFNAISLYSCCLEFNKQSTLVSFKTLVILPIAIDFFSHFL